MTIFTSGFPPYAAAASSGVPASSEIAIEYLEQHLAPQDIQFMNVRGFNGAPDWGQDFSQYEVNEISRLKRLPTSTVATLFRYLYDAPSIESAHTTAAYCNNIQFLKNNESAIQTLNSMLAQNGLDETTKAMLGQSLTNLQNIKADHLRPYQDQMTRLLDDFSSLLEHRGVISESSIIEAINGINAVKRNITSFQSPQLPEEAAEFFTIYTENIKYKCEFLIAHARNPFHLANAFTANTCAGQLPDQALRNAMETERPRVMAYAERLKQVLAPYARISPTPRNEASEKTQHPVLAPNDPSGGWVLA